MTAQPSAGPLDPEVQPAGSYAVEPALARELSHNLVATSGDVEAAYAPFTGRPVAPLPLSTPADVATAFGTARVVQRHWAHTSAAERSRILLRFHDLVLERQAELLDLIQVESGKSRKHAFEEIGHVALTARYYARTLAGTLSTSRHGGIFPVLTRVDVARRPKGVVGIISPWNYPLTMAVSDGLAALAAGNGVVAKPDSQTMLSALAAVDLLTEAGLPEGLWQVVHGPGPVIGAAIVDQADYVCFTGSTATGRLIAGRCADRLIGCSLELGGKNPMLVLHDADVDRAADTAVRSCFSSAGQLCVATERLLVADPVFDRFVERFVRRTRALRLSAAMDFTGDVGSLVSEQQLHKTAAHVDDAVAKGARVLTGGRTRPDIGPLFYQPTILTGVTPRMACFGEETFGPVVSVYRFVDEADAVDRANAGPFGLNASICTRDVRRGRALAARIRCGTVNVNEGYAASFGSLSGPMGGMGQSGLGRRQGAEGLLRFTETQTVAAQRLLAVSALPGLSADSYARVMTGFLRVLRRTRRP